MSDFYQHNVIATLHRLGKPSLKKLEKDLVDCSRRRHIALIIPVTFNDSRRTAFEDILKELSRVPYLKRKLFTIGRTEKFEQFVSICRKVKAYCPDSVMIWASGPRMSKLIARMENTGLPLGGDGKGRNVWLAYGNVISNDDCRVIAVHDADIVNYNRELLARLVFPVASPIQGYEFSKGYYSRVSDRMYGRVTRLFVTPLIRAYRYLLGESAFLTYMDAFRYPLSGEVAISISLARINQVPGDWGLEVGTLAEVYRNCAHRWICQVDVCENYEHKHQELGEKGKHTGLALMAEDIAKVFFRTLASEGAVFTTSHLQSLVGIYRRHTYNIAKHHEADAALNGLIYDRHAELLAAETFAHSLVRAGEAFLDDPLGKPQIPNWNRVAAASDSFLRDIVSIPEEDMKEAESYSG